VFADKGGPMTGRVKRLTVYMSLVAMPFGTATVLLTSRRVHPRHTVEGTAIRATDAAFSDGLYLGKLDAESGRKQHLSIGRWSAAKDRASFVAGYQQGYEQAQNAKSANRVR
jgi:hypothetical protein